MTGEGGLMAGSCGEQGEEEKKGEKEERKRRGDDVRKRGLRGFVRI